MNTDHFMNQFEIEYDERYFSQNTRMNYVHQYFVPKGTKSIQIKILLNHNMLQYFVPDRTRSIQIKYH